MAAAPARRLVGPQGVHVERLGAVEPVGVGVSAGQHHRQLDAPLGVGPAESGSETAVDEGAVAHLDDLLRVLAARHGVEAAQHEQRALGVVPAGAGAGEVGEALGAARHRHIAAEEALHHELHALQTHPGGARLMPCGLRLDRTDGVLRLAVVQQGLREPDNRVDAQVTLQAGHRESGLEVPDRGGGRGEEGRAAQFEEHVRVALGPGRFQ